MCFQHTIVNTFYLFVYTELLLSVYRWNRAAPDLLSTALRAEGIRKVYKNWRPIIRETKRSSAYVYRRFDKKNASLYMSLITLIRWISRFLCFISALHIFSLVLRVSNFWKEFIFNQSIASLGYGCLADTLYISRMSDGFTARRWTPRSRREDAEWFVNAAHYGVPSSLGFRARLPGAFARADEDLSIPLVTYRDVAAEQIIFELI